MKFSKQIRYLRPLLKARYATLTAIVILALLLRVGFVVFKRGFRMSGDTEVFVRTCGNLLSIPLLGQVNGLVGLQYSGFLLPFCGINSLFGLTIWGYLLVVMSALTTAGVYLLGSELFDEAVGLTAAFLQVGFYDSIRWSQELFTDPMFTFLLTVSTWRIAVWTRQRTKRNLAIASFLTVWAALTRPFGMPMLLTGVFLYGGYRYRKRIQHHIISIFVLGFTIGSYIFILLKDLFYGHLLESTWGSGHIFYNGEALPGTLIPGSIQVSLTRGIIPVADAFAQALAVSFVRVAAFFHPFRYFWEPSHTIHFFYTLYYIPLLLVGFVGAWFLYQRDKVKFIFLSTPVVATLLITTIVFVSRRFRYRSPLGPAIVLFAAYALSVYVRDGSFEAANP